MKKPTIEYHAELLRRRDKLSTIFWLVYGSKVAFTKYRTNQSHTRGVGEAVAIEEVTIFNSAKQGARGCVPNKSMVQCPSCLNYTKRKANNSTFCNYCDFILPIT